MFTGIVPNGAPIQKDASELKHGDKLVFREIPERKGKFYFPEDEQATKEAGGGYTQYYSKIGPGQARVYLSSPNSSRIADQEFDVDPESPIIYLNINSL